MAIETAKQSLLNPVGFRFEIKDLPNFNPNVQEVNLPDMEIINITSPTPFSNIQVPGDKINFSPLSVRFLIDENMQSWQDIYNWIYGLGFPDEFGQYQNLIDSSDNPGPHKGIVSEGNLYILTNSYNPNLRIIFKEIFPTALTQVQFSLIGDIQTVSATATFIFRSFELLRDI